MNQKIKYLVLSFIFIIYCFEVNSQTVNIQDGTSVYINNGTSIALKNDTLNIGNSTLVNDGEITFDSNGFLTENSGFPISGLGTEEITLTPTNPFYNSNIGGFGLSLTTIEKSNGISLKRGHEDIYPNQKSMLRWFEFDNPINITSFIFEYDNSELNGLNQLNLSAINYNKSISNWEYLNGNSNKLYFEYKNETIIERIILSDRIDGGEISLFPNPSFEELIISNLPLNEEIKLTIHSVEGKIINQNTLITSNLTLTKLNVTYIESGVYFITLSMSDKLIFNQKWVKL